MVRVCVFPSCSNKMTSWTSFSFHRLPLGNLEMLKLWLVALKIDPNTRVEALRRADHRVCGAHFAKEDFFPLRPHKEGQKVQRLKLRKSATPMVAPDTADTTEKTASGKVDFPKPDSETHLQCTPVKSKQRADEEPSVSSGPSLSSALTLLLTSPPQTATSSKQSLPGKYIALAPTWSRSAEQIPSTSTSTAITAQPSASSSSQLLKSEEEGEMKQEVCDTSMSSGDLSVAHTYSSSVLPSSDSQSSTGTMSESVSSSGDTATGRAEKKWLVNGSYLIQLFQTCPKCSSVIIKTKITTKGSEIEIQWTCGKHSGDWQSCPDLRGKPENNLQISASKVFTGSTHKELAALLDVPIPHKTQFDNIQTTYLLHSAYQDKRYEAHLCSDNTDF